MSPIPAPAPSWPVREVPEPAETAPAAPVVDRLEPHPEAAEAVFRLVDAALPELPPGGQLDLQGIGVLGAIAGIGAVSVKRTREGKYELTLADRGGAAAGTSQDFAQGMAMATLGGSVTREFPSRDALARGLFQLASRPVASALHLPGIPSRVSLSVQTDALGIADVLPVELKGALSGKQELSLDWKTGLLTQRLAVEGSQGGALVLEGRLGQALALKAETDRAAVTASVELALAYRFQLSPEALRELAAGRLEGAALARALVRARRLGGPTLEGAARFTVGSLAVTASRSASLSELASPESLFDPARMRFTVDASHTRQLTAFGGWGPFAFRAMAGRTEPGPRREGLTEDEALEAIRR